MVYLIRCILMWCWTQGPLTRLAEWKQYHFSSPRKARNGLSRNCGVPIRFYQ